MRKVILFTSLAALLLCGVVGEPLAQCTEPIPGFTLLKYVCTVKPFSNIFELVIDPKIITEYQWTQAHFDTFMNAVIDSNTSNTDDSFPLIWDYFCFTDQNLKWDEVEFRTDSGDTTTITIELWHPDDYPGGTARSAYMRVVASTSDPVLAATNRTFLHELAHVCDFANLWWTGTSEFNTWSGEQFAEGAEYLYGYPLGSGGNIFFDGSMNAVRPSDGQPNRGRFGLFHTYLFANYSGVPSDPSDDLTYNWIRNSPRNIEYYGLGHTLETMRTTYPGYDNLEAGADTMMGNLFHDFAIALYVSRSDTLGPYGFGSFDSRDTNLFDHTDSTVIRARNIPPRFILDDENLSGPIASMVYEDPEQSDSTACSPPLGRTFREFGVRRWGAEYLEFRGDESFFSTQGDTMLGIRLDPIGDLPPGTALRVGYIAYDSYDEILYDKTIVGDIQKQIAIVRPGDDPVVKFCIPNFGVTNKSVVVVISLVDDPIPLNTPNCVDSSIHCFEEGSPCDEPHLKYQLTYEYAPKILAFPGAFLNIQEAIDSAAVNQTVTIAPSPFPYEGGFTMKRGVSVVSLDPSEQPTIIDTVSSQVVLFPDFGSSPNVPDTSTVLDGIEVVGGTDAAIRFEGGGKIVNCLIDRDFDENSVAIEVNFPNRTASTAAYYAVVRDSEINLDYGTGNTGSFDGVRTRGGITEVAGTRIRMLGEAAMMSEYNGIHSEVGDPNQASVASYCLITGESGTGMRFEEDLDKAIYCTVDSTDLGYYSVGTNAVQFCIASNNSGSIYSIKGTGSVYGCITTGDIEQPATFSFQNTDPEYCGSGDYTLNYDSLGNPETNAVPPDPGDQIGAFPPACLFGTLDFDVDFDDGALPVYGDITIPVGRTLTLRQGSIVQISETDVLSSGDDSSTVEIRVYGNLTADGTSADSVFFAPPAGAGSWDGLILGADSELSLTYASIGGAKYCVRDNLTFGANIQIYSSQFYAFQTAGIYLRPIGVGQEPSICRVFNSFIDMRGAPYGIYISEQVSSQPTYEVFIGGDRSAYGGAANTIMGDGQSVYGIYLDCEGSPPNRDARIDSMTVKSLTSGTGIYIEDYSPSLEFNEIQSCSRGIQIRGHRLDSMSRRNTR